MPHQVDEEYDYSLKFLLVGDSDVGKEELLAGLPNSAVQLPYSTKASHHKSTIIVIDGKRVKLQLWDTSGQGRFCTVLRSYSRGAQGILLVYDITNKWSFGGIERWLSEVNEHAPGVPKILIGNRLHLAYNRQVSEFVAGQYSEKHDMAFYEVSSLCDFNVLESLAELSRLVLKRNGMNRSSPATGIVPSLYDLCTKVLANRVTLYGIERLPLPAACKTDIKSYSLTHRTDCRLRNYKYASLRPPDRARKQILNPQETPKQLRKSCVIS
ncbi:ras-related protein Rab-40C-like [Watersipora subatra]|uniref:ras-related protein Rab-40C-like n=1 Tax=Watersipora subatra TaxID=2589382 RepID=UPI00355ADA0B